METFVFFTGVSALLLHELDAIQQQEWRFLLGWMRLGDVTTYRVFAAAHLPLFLVILALLPNVSFQIGFDVFMIVHAVAHTVLRNHPMIQFNTLFSRLWIYGGALAAALHLLLIR